jgi:adenosylcobinamide-phosphate synthase
MNWPLVMLIALCLEGMMGWPDRLHRRIGHPVTWIGALVSRLERGWNRPDLDPGRNRIAGATAAIVAVGAAATVAVLVALVLPDTLLGHFVAGALTAPLLAARSLNDHVAAVASPLGSGDIREARRAVSHIVGRNPERLDEAGLARASLESLAENASDGVIAPLFWGVLLGLPGIAAYKAVNTLDSMIGHRTPRYTDFGKFAARLDDAVNWPAARLTGFLFAMAGGRPSEAIMVMRRDAPLHRSPNAGWPESALASALGCRLSGPRAYHDRMSQEPWINGTAPDPRGADVIRGLGLYRRTMLLAAAALAVLAA